MGPMPPRTRATPAARMAAGDRVDDEPCAMSSLQNIPSAPIQFERWRPYLRMLARMQIESRFQAKIDASDIVQQTMLDAHQAQDQFRGNDDDDLRAWLRRILARNLADEVRKYRRDKRNAALEQSLNVALDESSAGFERCPCGSRSSSGRARDRQ